MKKISTLLAAILFVFSLNAQNSYTINSGNFYYTPQLLTINLGDTVHWINDGGFHNVNFDVNTLSGASFNNPVSFVSTPTNDVEMYTYVFTVAGNYDYDCSVGSHAANGMVGTIIVNAASSLENLSVSNKILSKTYNLLGKKTSKKSKGLIIYSYSDGSTEKKIILK
ncbi:MAG: plastocyanin/azurin family copper-binding protein [Flavobacteriales bacterium]